MADEVNANINVNIDTSQALAQLKDLQRQISQFHTSIARSSATASAAQRSLQTDFLNAVNATGKFAAELRTIKSASESFTDSLERNKFSMGEYFRYAGGASKTFGRLFRGEFDTIQKVAEDRVKKLQTQYIKMGRDANGALKAISVTPLTLDMDNLATKTMIAAQKQQLFNELISKGTTNLINFGKNTQWAGRQLMVGFTIPLSIFGSQASKAFMDIEQQALRFKRVYGDLFTTTRETNIQLEAIRGLAAEYTKYGVAIKDTMSLAADAAAAGMKGAQLQETVKQSTKLAVLGEVDKQQAFQATISLQTAFQMSNDQLAQSIDFLNAVENQSVVSLQDMTDAIPRVAPVIRGLGGDVKDLAVFMAAMKEGGVDAASAANGLKSALGSLINPSKAAKEMLQGVGIDLQGIVTQNQGNLMRTVIQLGDAMKELAPLARQRILEQLFGKYQFARVSALFDNIARSGSQASQVMELVGLSAQDLARISNKELSAIEENSVTKFKAAVEGLKNAIAPVGEIFLKIATPIIEMITKVADKFNGLSDHTKQVIAVIVTVLGAVAPVVLMLVGLVANFVGQMGKFFTLIRNGYLKLTGDSKVLGEQTGYLTSKQIEEAAVAASLDQVHSKLIQTFTTEAEAVMLLKNAYTSAATAAERFLLANPGTVIPGRMPRRKKMATGGIVRGPGNGTSDSVPTMLSNGEAVIPAKNVQKYPQLTAGLVAGNIPGFKNGLFPLFTNAVTLLSSAANQGLKGSSGYSAEALSQEFKGGGAGIQAPIIRAIAESLGATNTRQIVQMIHNNPSLKEFGHAISMGVAEELAAVGGKVTDPQLTKIYQKIARQEAAKRGQAFSDATEKFFTQKTTFEDTTQTRIGSTGRVRSIGRSALFSGIKSYRNMGFAAIANALGLPSIAGLVKAHVSPREMVDISELEGLTPAAQAAIARSSGQIVDTAKTKVARTQKSASPSQVAKQLAFDFGAGYEEGLQESLPGIAASGEAIADAAAGGASGGGTGTPTGGTTGGGKGRGRRFGKIAARFKGFRGVGAASAVSGLAIGASMMPGPVGDFAQKLMPAVMGLQTLSMVLPLLTNPIGAIAVGLGGLAFLIHKTNQAYEEHIKAIKDSAKTEVARKYGSMGAVENYAKFTGTSLASARQFNRVGDKRFISADVTMQQGFNEYYKSDLGKTSRLAITKAKDKESAIAMDIAKRAATTNMSPAQIAANIKSAAEIAGGANEIKIKTKLQGMLAPNGKDILKEPLTLQAKIKFLSSDTQKQINVLNSQISKLAKPVEVAPIIVAGGGRGAAQAAAQAAAIATQKNRDKQIRDTAIASELAKNAILQQREALAQLNAAYVDGTITEKEYNAQHAEMMAGFQGIGSSINSLIAQLDKMDKSGKASKAMLSDLADSVLADFAKTNKQTTKLIKEILSAMPDQVETKLLFGLAEGSLQPTDIIAINDLMTNMNGKTFEQKMKLVANVQGSEAVRSYLRILVLTDQYQKVLASGGRAAAGQLLLEINKEQANLDAINKAIKEKGGSTGTKDIPNSTNTTTQTSFLDAVVRKMRDAYFANQKLTEGFTASKKAIDAMFGRTLNMANGLEARLKKMGAGQQLSDLILGLDPATFEKNKSLFFTFTDKAKTKIKDLSKWAKELNKLLQLDPLANYLKDQQQKITDNANKIKVLNKLLASGIPYQQALEQLQGMPSEVLQEFANTDRATSQWKQLLQVIKDVNDITKMTPTDVANYIGGVANDAISYIDHMSAVVQDLANVGQLNQQTLFETTGLTAADVNLQGQTIDLKADQKAIDAANIQVQKAQDLIDAQQVLLDLNNHEIDLEQHKIDLIDQNIASKQRLIDGYQKYVEATFDAPLQALSDESNILSNALSQIDHQAQAINEQYDAQQKAMEAMNKLNQEAIQQGKTKMSIADALVRGDIAAAAQAQQDLEAQQAAAQAGAMQTAMDAARNQAINGLSVNGMTRAQIEERQYQIQQQSFTLEQNKAAYIKANILPLQKEIADLEESKVSHQLKIQDLQNDNYKIQQKIYDIETGQMKTAKDALKAAEAKLKADQDTITAINEQIKVNGMNKDAWELVRDKASLTYDKIVAMTKEIWNAVAAAQALAAALAAAAAAQAALGSSGGRVPFVNGTTPGSEVLSGVQNATSLTDMNAALSNVDVTTVDPSAVANAMLATVTSDPAMLDALGGIAGAASSARYTGQALAWAQQYAANNLTISGGGGGLFGSQMKTFGGKILRRAGGGIVPGTGLLDKVHALLTPGEFVINKTASQEYAPLLESINQMQYPNMNNPMGRATQKAANISLRKSLEFTDNSSDVYNYKVDVNIAGTNSDPETIASAVINKIKELESAKIRRRLQSS